MGARPGQAAPHPGDDSMSRTEHEPAEDPRVFAVVQEYLAALEKGQRLERRELLARHPEIAEEVSECLDGLEFVHSTTRQLREQAGVLPVPGILPGEEARAPLGDFQIVRELGRGGMGIVYEAVQLSLGRRVALKVLPFAATLDARQLQRFKNEAQAAAHFHHPNIVPVFGVGCDRGVHYYAMQHIEGRTLADLIGESGRPDATTVAAGKAAAQTLRDQPAEPSAQ